MVLDSLASSLRNTLKKIANATHIDKNLIKEVIRDIQRALIQADVNVKMVINLTKAVEERALTEKPASGMSSREHVIRIIYDELVKILGNAKISKGVTTLDLYYRYSEDNSSWTNWTFYDTDFDVRDGWSWDFNAESINGSGYYEFYSIRTVKFEYTTEKEIEPPGADAVVFVE